MNARPEWTRNILVAILALWIIVLASYISWFNRAVLPVIWAGTAIVGDLEHGAPWEMSGIVIGFRSDGMVIWKRRDQWTHKTLK